MSRAIIDDPRPEARAKVTPPVKSWAVTDRLSVYNFHSHDKLDFTIGDEPIGMRVVEGALITAFVNRLQGGDGADELVRCGAVYGPDGSIDPGFIDHAKRLRGHAAPDHVAAERFREAEWLDEDCLYLGTLHSHFGHFLVESLSRAWAVALCRPDMPIVFHYANGAAERPKTSIDRIVVPEHVRVFLQAAGVTGRRLVLANRDIRVRRLLMPTNLLVFDETAHRALPGVYDAIAEAVRPPRSLFRWMFGLDASPPRRRSVYLTRRQVAAASDKARRKSFANEDALERLFASRGYEIVAPETLTPAEQVALVRNAWRLAGSTGSALHMILFCNRPDTQVIAVDWRRSRTQLVLGAVRGVRCAHIAAGAGFDADRAPLANIALVERALDQIDAAVPAPVDEPPVPRRWWAWSSAS